MIYNNTIIGAPPTDITANTAIPNVMRDTGKNRAAKSCYELYRLFLLKKNNVGSKTANAMFTHDDFIELYTR